MNESQKTPVRSALPAVMDTPASRPLVVVCLDNHPKAIVLLRIARNRALSMNGHWRAVFIETPQHMRQSEDGAQERMLHLLTQARQMGGETEHIEAQTVEKGFAQLLEGKKEPPSLLIMGSAEVEDHWLKHRSASSRLVDLARARAIAIEIVPLSGQHHTRAGWDIRRWVNPMHIAYALLAVTVAYLGAITLEYLLPPALFRINYQNVALLFMTACAFVAGRYGLLPALAASVASFLTVHYYFTAPFREFKLVNVTDLLNIAIFFSAALLISLFTSQTRGYADRTARREKSTQVLFTLYRIGSNAFSRHQALEELQRKLTRMLEMEVAFFLPPLLNPDHIEPAFPTGLELNDADRTALDICWKEMRTTGVASPSNPGTLWRFEPMVALSGEVGVLGVRPGPRARLDAWVGSLLAAIADQTATILEREKLRSMLLSSVSHDLRTPLSAIIGALNIYRTQGGQLSAEKRDALLETAVEESERLSSFITNILDMTRLESGHIVFRKEWHNPRDMVQQVTKRLTQRLRARKVNVSMPEAEIEVSMDPMMTEQVLQNVLDNACKYTPAGSPIDIRLGIDGQRGFFCEVRDYGSGIPEEKLGRVFDKYARLQKVDSQVAGTGLGLAICKAIMEAQQGSIIVMNHPEGGAVFAFHLPQWRQAVDADKYEQ